VLRAGQRNSKYKYQFIDKTKNDKYIYGERNKEAINKKKKKIPKFPKLQSRNRQK
jgi:hypothetical protein